MIIFNSLEHFMEWTKHNCNICLLGSLNKNSCDLEKELMTCYYRDFNKFTPELGKKIGYEKYKYMWDCPKKVLVKL